MDGCTVNVGVINQINNISVSKDIAPSVGMASINGNMVPLFHVKNGRHEYFVFRTPKAK